MYDHQCASSGLVHHPLETSALFADSSHYSAIQAVGIDLVEIARVRGLVQRWGESALTRLFTEYERSICRTTGGTSYRWQSLAGRFAAKEATKKVLAAHGEAVNWHDIEVVTGSYGEPHLHLYGSAREASARLQYQQLLLSISHDGGFAIAIVVARQ